MCKADLQRDHPILAQVNGLAQLTSAPVVHMQLATVLGACICNTAPAAAVVVAGAKGASQKPRERICKCHEESNPSHPTTREPLCMDTKSVVESGSAASGT
jgi:hypothetical protein